MVALDLNLELDLHALIVSDYQNFDFNGWVMYANQDGFVTWTKGDLIIYATPAFNDSVENKEIPVCIIREIEDEISSLKLSFSYEGTCLDDILQDYMKEMQNFLSLLK